jgi:hypothetical protein
MMTGWYPMGDELANLVYQAAPGMSWVVQTRGIRVIDEAARHSKMLDYPEALVWEELARGRDGKSAAGTVCRVTNLDEVEAEALVRQLLCEWMEAGWIEKKVA